MSMMKLQSATLPNYSVKISSGQGSWEQVCDAVREELGHPHAEDDEIDIVDREDEDDTVLMVGTEIVAYVTHTEGFW